MLSLNAAIIPKINERSLMDRAANIMQPKNPKTTE